MPFTSKENSWTDAGYDGPLPDGAVLLRSSTSYTASTGNYTFKLNHDSIGESASRFRVYVGKDMSSNDAKAAALTRIKNGEIKPFEVLLGYIKRYIKNDASSGMEEDSGEEGGGSAAWAATTHHAPRAGQGKRAPSYSPQEKLEAVRIQEFRARRASSSSSFSSFSSSSSSSSSSWSWSSSSSSSLGGDSKGAGGVFAAKDQPDKSGGVATMTVASMGGVAAAAATVVEFILDFSLSSSYVMALLLSSIDAQRRKTPKAL